MWNNKEMSELGGTLTSTFDFDLWPWNCISGMGGPIVMERKGRYDALMWTQPLYHLEAEDTVRDRGN